MDLSSNTMLLLTAWSNTGSHVVFLFPAAPSLSVLLWGESSIPGDQNGVYYNVKSKQGTNERAIRFQQLYNFWNEKWRHKCCRISWINLRLFFIQLSENFMRSLSKGSSPSTFRVKVVFPFLQLDRTSFRSLWKTCLKPSREWHDNMDLETNLWPIYLSPLP